MPGTKTQRLDARVLELGLFASRQIAQSAIIDGAVQVNGLKITKPGAPVAQSARIEIASGWGPPRFVSRGGLKLEKALVQFHIDPAGRICLDVGASTGGFTDCLLKHGAALVYAIDVGYGQLDWSLRKDPRVIVKERVNARLLSCDRLYGAQSAPADLAVLDVSFISLGKVIPAVAGVMPGTAEVVCLIKPQFEAGRAQVGKGGVVRSPEVHIQVIENLLAAFKQSGLNPCNLTYSPIKGPAGNIEYLVHLGNRLGKEISVDRIVQEAHRVLSDGG